MGHLGEKLLWYFYTPRDPLSCPPLNYLVYPNTRVENTKNPFFRGNFDTQFDKLAQMGLFIFFSLFDWYQEGFKITEQKNDGFGYFWNNWT